MQLEVSEVSFFLPSRGDWLLEKQSLSFGSGSLSAIMGPSGSGKSTFLNILGGLTSPTTGKVLIRIQENQAPNRVVPQDFAWILQSNAVLAGRTAIDNIVVGLLAEGHTHRSARSAAVSVLDELGLGLVASTPISLLSGGEVQRVTAARCLLSASPIILADEPTGQLDFHNSLAIIEALRVIADAGKIVIVATHDNAISGHFDVVFDLVQGTFNARAAK